ncbi:MAG: hypothetical protein MHM6MM_009534, partial [Cercozoa sp. M6MM]
TALFRTFLLRADASRTRAFLCSAPTLGDLLTRLFDLKQRHSGSFVLRHLRVDCEEVAGVLRRRWRHALEAGVSVAAVEEVQVAHFVRSMQIERRAGHLERYWQTWLCQLHFGLFDRSRVLLPSARTAPTEGDFFRADDVVFECLERHFCAALPSIFESDGFVDFDTFYDEFHKPGRSRLIAEAVE